MKNFIYVSLVFMLAAGCASDENTTNDNQSVKEIRSESAENKAKHIQELESQVEADSSGEKIGVRKQLLVSYSDFVNFYNQDDRAPEYLFRAAKLSNEIGKPRKAIEYLINLHDGFPKYERRTEAAFLVAFIYENMLNDRQMAEKYYEQVVELYPESSWADDAQASLAMLYMTDEEKIKQFLNQQETP